jgi:DNA processing protein
MTDYGQYAAYELSRELASCGAVIVSGMAEGIDTASHKGCLAAGGFTIAVFGCGIDRVYPYENKDLMNKIIEKGLVLTEYPPGTEPKGFHFPVRNRIISGLSQAVLVVEADYKSGALITAKTALFQGREIYAVPGNINAKNSVGTNNLIRSHAGIATEAYDILSEYEHLYSHRINIEKTKYYNNKNNYAQKKEKPENIKNTEKPENNKNPDANLSEKLAALKIILNEAELKVFEVFYENKDKKLHSDEIRLDMPISDVMNTLTFLEIYGIIISFPGDFYKISDNFMNL